MVRPKTMLLYISVVSTPKLDSTPCGWACCGNASLLAEGGVSVVEIEAVMLCCLSML